MSATVIRFPSGDAVELPAAAPKVLEKNAKGWIEDGLQHQIKASEAITAGEVATAIEQLTLAEAQLARARAVLRESLGRSGDQRALELEAIGFTVSAVAGEIGLLLARAPALTARRIDDQVERLDNAQARLQRLAELCRGQTES